MKPGAKDSATIQIKYSPTRQSPLKEQGIFLLQSNTTSTLSLKVSGAIPVSQIFVIPNNGSCIKDSDCKAIDSRLSCNYDKISKKTRCLVPPTEKLFLLFSLTSKGQSATKTFVLRSTGDKPLRINKIQLDPTSSSAFKLKKQELSFPMTMDAGREKEFAIEYTPSPSPKEKATGQIIISSDAINAPLSVIDLKVASRGCDIEVSPPKHRFTGAGTPLLVNVANRGDESCVLKQAYLKFGNSFSLIPTTIPEQAIAPGHVVKFRVDFRPPESDKEYKDVVILETSDPNEPVTKIELTGREKKENRCTLKATPSRLVYGLVGLGKTRKLSLTLTNETAFDCKITSLNVAGTKPSGNNAFKLTSKIKLPLRLSSGADIRLEVAYTPPQELPGYEGTLTISSNDKLNPSYVVPLLGASGVLCLEALPPTMDFGSSKSGCSSMTRKLQIYHLGMAKCQRSISITSVGLAQGTTPEFRIMSAPPVPKAIHAGESLQVTMSYKPKTVGFDTGFLAIENNVQGQSPFVVPLSGEGVSSDEQKDIFKQVRRPLVDILLVVDDSSTIGSHQANLAKNFKSFINWTVRLNVDYHILVTTTDVTGRRAPAGCARGNPKFITPKTPNPIAAFEKNVLVGTSGSASEKGMEAAYRALIPPASNICNKGFYRQAASLVMIFISDEEDQSPQQVQFYINFFRSLKGPRNLDLLRASVVVGPPPKGCRTATGSAAQAAPRYWKLAKELKGIQESICASNWVGTSGNPGSLTFGYRSQFYLSRPADPKTIQVKVGGNIVKESTQNGWQYDATANSVNFAKSVIPAPSSTIQIDYKARCLP